MSLARTWWICLEGRTAVSRAYRAKRKRETHVVVRLELVALLDPIRANHVSVRTLFGMKCEPTMRYGRWERCCKAKTVSSREGGRLSGPSSLDHAVAELDEGTAAHLPSSARVD